MLDVGQPLTRRLTALRRARSLRDPTTSLLKFSPPAALSTWDLPNDTEDEEEEEDECESRHDGFVYSKRDSTKFTSIRGAEKNSVSCKMSGRLSGDFKNLRQALDQENSTEEFGINRSDIGVSLENGLKRRDEGERAVLHNWPNECFDDECRDPVRNDRDFQPRRSVDESKLSSSRREIEHGNGERAATKQGRRDRLFKGGKKDSVSRSANVSPSLHNSADAFSLFLLGQEDPCEVGDDTGGLSWMHRSRASGVDCDSRSGSPLLTKGDVKCREWTGKNNKKICSNISKYIGKQKEDSQTPTSVRSVNNDGRSSIRGSCDGTAFSGDDEMDGLDLPRHGCGIPCYWPRTPRHRSKNFMACRGRNLSCGPANSVRRKSSSILPRSKIAAQKDLMASVYDSKRSEELNLDMEVLPLLTDVGETAASSAEDDCDGFSNDSRDLFSEEASLNRKRSRQKGREKLELALTSESRELTVYTDMHRSLSQKYRPRSFDELVGQNMVVQSLVNAVLKGKVAPVYLFQGPRGTGKTSTARIFATALNCISLEELRPCGLCRECTAFTSGKSGDVREVDATNSNGLDKVKSLLKNVASAPSFSRFKIFIIDECHMLVSETWTALLKCLEEPPAHAVFILVTTDPDKLPDTAVSRCQKYLFPKIKESEIVSRLQKLAIEENLDVDTDALDFIAIKADGSLRDAETMLDQLSLLGQRITLSMVHDLVGVVSDEKLLDLLDLALSADAASTVRKARDLIGSGIEPMVLMSQLANLIMDILAGSCKTGDNKHKGVFFHRHAFTDDDLDKLRRALRILSEAEKQLRASNDRTTWLTAALLQFAPSRSLLFPNSTGTSVIQSPITLRNTNERGVIYFDSPTRQKRDKEKNNDAHLEQLDLMTLTKSRISKLNGSMKTLSFTNCHEENKGRPVSNSNVCNQASEYSPTSSGFMGGVTTCEREGESPINKDDCCESGQTEMKCIDERKLDVIWRMTIEEFHSDTLKQLLQSEGKLVSVSAAEGLAIAQLEFRHPDHKSRAERSWKSIANSLQHVLGCNVEVRFCLASQEAEADYSKCRKDVLDLPNSSANRQRKKASTMFQECMHQSVAIDSSEITCGVTITNAQSFAETPQLAHGQSPMPVQHFQAGTLSTVNMIERNDLNTTSCNKQEGSRTSKGVISNEHRLERAWSREEEKCISEQLDIPNPEKQQVHPHVLTDLQNGIKSSEPPVVIPFRVTLQHKEGILNCKTKTVQLNIQNDVQNRQSVKLDEFKNAHSTSQNPFVACLEDKNLECGSSSESASFLCWKHHKTDQSKASKLKRRPLRKSGLLTWVVPCAKAKR